MGNIHKKLQKIQTELKVPKSKYSEYGGYSYRSLEDIYEAVKPLLDREGLILVVSETSSIMLFSTGGTVP